ncbi:MAG: RNA 2',3'-cyclic phosphodiesterase [Firmicutes bacterium]|nr:RNA 2',3'-cyclic phosphodiesterase [Bacillota bacterium]
MRAFLAINLDHKIREELTEIQKELKGKIKGIRRVAPRLLHITIKFLGKINEEQVALMKAPLRKLASRTSSFKISLAGLGAFPSPARPRVIWIGISDGRKALVDLAKEIEKIYEDLQFKDATARINNKKYRPHLTIGRKKRSEIFEAEPSVFTEPWECKTKLNIDSIYLMKSVLRPTGPLYTPLQKFLLK